MAEQLLFNQSNLSDHLDQQLKLIHHHLAGISQEDDLDKPTLRDDLTSRAGVRAIKLRREEAALRVLEPTQYEKHHVMELAIPFEGSGYLLYLKASTYGLNPPTADIESGLRAKKGDRVIFRSRTAGVPSEETVRQWAKGEADRLETYLGYQDTQLANHEAQVRVEIERGIERRRQEIAALGDLNSGLSKGGI